ncbi:MAG: pseudouridine synthase [Syntrophales bacterium]|nr:pseudouridine synthase [Syntrophales bacterium]
MKERLQKIIARAGVASRRAAEEMILAGRVSVNGRIVNVLGTQADSGDDIRVNGIPLSTPAPKRYVMIHKPAGYVTTLRDPEGRPTVRDLVSSIPERLYPVGRLDYDSEGLLIMTNDGDLAYGLQHPRFGVPKTYLVKVAGRISAADIQKLAAGIKLKDGVFKPADVRLDRYTSQNSWLEITIAEGRNRIVRRAMDYLGYPVRRLIRMEIGGVILGGLKCGEHRDLAKTEIETLMFFLKN